MGASGSKLSKDELNTLEKHSNFDSRQIQKLFKSYRELDIQPNGSIDSDQLLNLPELSINPLRKRIVNMVQVDEEKNGIGLVSFNGVVKTLSPMSELATLEEKIKFAFRIYDINGDGVIDHSGTTPPLT